MSQVPIRRLNNEQSLGLGPDDELFIKKKIRTNDGRPVEFPDGINAIGAGIVRNVVVILGSSNGAGFGASTYAADPVEANGWQSPVTSWAGLLASGLQAIDPTWTVINRSISGTGTASSISRFWTDVAPFRPSHVVLCTHPVNDGYNASLTLRNTITLISYCRAIGAVPILRGAYMHNSMTATNYADMLALNRQLDLLNCHRIDHFSLLDTGSGGFIGGTTYSADGLHSNDIGYAALYSAIDLGIFLSGSPDRAVPPSGNGAWIVDAAATNQSGLSVSTATNLRSALKSFTMRSRIKGIAAAGPTSRAFLSAFDGSNPLRVQNSATTYGVSWGGVTLITSAIDPTTSTAVRDVVITYNHLTRVCRLFIDGTAIAPLTDGVASTPVDFSTLTFGARHDTASANGYSFADLGLWNVPLSASAISDMWRTQAKQAASMVFSADLGGAPPAAASRGYAPSVINNGAWGQIGTALWNATTPF